MKKLKIGLKMIFLIIIPVAIIMAFVLNDVSKTANPRIGILQLVEHDALDEARKGFLDGLAEHGLIDGENITIDYENAQGEQSNCCLLTNKLINKKTDLILSIATPAAQALANATKDIPILVTAITSPQAAGLVETKQTAKINDYGKT